MNLEVKNLVYGRRNLVTSLLKEALSELVCGETGRRQKYKCLSGRDLLKR